MKTQGRHGEVATETHSDVDGRFQPGMRFSAFDKSTGRRELRVEALWPHKGMLVFKFAGVDSISDAELLVGSELQVPREERAQLEPGWSYISDLVGCTVFDTDLQGNDREVGVVENVQFGAGEAPLLVVRGGAQEYEIPYAQAYLKGVDLGQKRIEMLLPEGILEVNAPLTADEKREQNEGAGKKETRRREGANS